MFALFMLAAALPSRLAPSSPRAAVAQDPEVPAAVEEAARQGRYWRASRLLGAHLAGVADTTPETILFASRMSAGWGDWETVSALLEGRPWLNEVGGASGWRLLARSRIAQGRLEAGDQALDRYLRVARPGGQEAGLALIRRGLTLTAAGETGAAIEALDSAAVLLPWMNDWIQLYAANAAAAAGDTAAVRQRLSATDPALAEERGWELRLRAARSAGDNIGARQVALDAARGAASASQRAQSWATLGDLRLEGGDTARARASYRSGMEAAPGSIGAVSSARGLSDLNPSPEEWRTIGSTYLRHGNPARAIAALERYLESGVGSHSERSLARLQLGEAMFNAGRYAEAESHLTALAADSVPARIAAQALYLTGRARYRQGRSEDGQRMFIELAERFPDQEATTRGLYLLADLKHDDLEIEDARRYYRQAVDASPALYEAGLAIMRLGGLAYLDGDFEAAARIYEEYLAAHPDGRRAEQATYWAARSYAQLGREADAERMLRQLRHSDPISFYGVRAAELLGTPVLDVPMGPSPPPDPAVDSLVESGLARVDLLAELDRRDDVVHEVGRLRRHVEDVDGGEYSLAEALNERAYTLTAVGMGWDLYRREGAWNPRLLRIVYPFPFREIILPEARERGIDPYLVAGVIRRESAFNPTVISSAGAIGLMQIMPETGRGLARGAGMQRSFDVELLKQPEVNVHLGVRYLEQLMERFDGDLPLVLSAYNAGPNRAARWRELPEHVDPDLLMERVPYSETRDYIRHVLMHRALYRELYPELPGGTE